MPLKKLSIVLFLLLILQLDSRQQSIRINEFSQGVSGSKEWVELVVTSTSPVGPTNCVSMKINIAGWILDDNNGDFSPVNHFTGSGMATGHLRFKNELPWINLPVGAIIVIYNAADKDALPNFPPDDPFDYNNSDCVYILPSNHASLEYCTNIPIATNCTTRVDYTSCIYTSSGTWSNIGLANAGDAIQVRDPAYNLIHGLVYGKSTSVSGCTTAVDMVGNSLAPLITNSAMGGLSASFSGTSSSDFFNSSAWTVQSASLATPGGFNNTNDSSYINDSIRGGCTCLKILPLGDQYNSILETSKNKIQVKITGGILKSNFGTSKYAQTVIIYDATGNLLRQEKIRAIKEINMDLNPLLSPGLNIVRVIVEDRVMSQFTFKIIKR